VILPVTGLVEGDGPLPTGIVPADVTNLRGLLAAGARTVALHCCRNGADVQQLAVLLSVAEAQEGIGDGTTRIFALSDGLLPAPRALENVNGKSARLSGLVWQHEALAGALRATRLRTTQGEWTGAFAAARSSVLLAALTAGIPAYDTVSDTDEEGFAADCLQSHADGFAGRIARDEAQADIIVQLYGGA
jgi:citrate lyase beta subunit